MARRTCDAPITTVEESIYLPGYGVLLYHRRNVFPDALLPPNLLPGNRQRHPHREWSAELALDSLHHDCHCNLRHRGHSDRSPVTVHGRRRSLVCGWGWATLHSHDRDFILEVDRIPGAHRSWSRTWLSNPSLRCPGNFTSDRHPLWIGHDHL